MATALEKLCCRDYAGGVSPPLLRFAELGEIGSEVEVQIEVAQGSFVKRKPDGSIDFVSPLRCPYNYGSILGTLAADGDPLDALVLGPKLGYGVRCTVQVRAVVNFVDAGELDPKVICSQQPLDPTDMAGVEAFFGRYARLKGWLNRLRRRRGPTRFNGWLAELDR